MFEKTNLAVIIPCYNELKNIEFFKNELLSFLSHETVQNSCLNFKFIIIENNSNDGTYESLVEMSKYFANELIIDQCLSQGYGAALKYGFNKYAKKSDYLAFLDFDNTYPLISLIDLFTKIKTKNLDLVFGVRLHKDSKIDNIRHFGNSLYVRLLKYLLKTNLSDVCSGMRIFRSDLANYVTSLIQNDLSFSIEFTTYAIINNWKIDEVEINYRERVGLSKLSLLKDGIKFLNVLLKTYFSKSHV